MAGSGERWVACGRCGRVEAVGPWVSGCPDCRRAGVISVMETRYGAQRPDAAPFGTAGGSFWAYAARLPVADPAARVTLGEGNTPLLALPRLGARLGLDGLHVKNETVNPTLSFKDRYAAVTLSVARSLGCSRVVASSTGNHGAATAAYAAAAGLACVVLCARHTPPLVLEQIQVHGGVPLVVEGPDRFGLVEHLAVRHGWFPAGLFLDMPVHNPYGVEGYKTLAYEIVRDLGAVPEVVVFPCARGNGLYGAWKGFCELRDLGVTARVPRMVACQPAAASTLERSLQVGRIVRLTPGPSVAGSVTEAFASGHALAALRASGGTAVGVPDEDALAHVDLLGAEGLWVEPSSAVALAGAAALARSGAVSPAERVVVVLTGAGVKWAGTTPGRARDVDRIEGRPEELEACLARRGLAL